MLKLTKKELLNNFTKIIAADETLKEILINAHAEPFGAVYGEYGKKCNVYIINEHFDNIIITEGLYTFRTYELKEATKKKYHEKLKKLNKKSALSKAYIELLHDYIDDFIKELNQKILLSSRKST